MPQLPANSLLSGLIARLRSLWRGLRRRGAVEADMSEEFRHHLELRTEDLIRRGVAPKEAARQARIEFGHVESHKEDARASRGLRLFDQIGFSWLDVKLGARMLRKYPGLSLVSVIGMAVAIAIGAGSFGAIYAMLDTTLPLPEGDRIVSLQNETNNPGNPDRQSLHDFALWREELRSVRDLAAFTADSRTLIVPGGTVELVPVARMTASGFRAARVSPVLGRPLLDEDERAGAPPVVVIAYEEWQRRFQGDPGIIGRPVRLGTETPTVVGVMPEGFRFPIAHRFWIPLRLDPTEHERGRGPSLYMFGRLADGVTLQRAQAELTALGLRMAAEHPETNAGLRPRIMAYTLPFLGVEHPAVGLALHALQLAISLLLVVVALNVAILVYARTTTRAGEIAVRTALGATRKRVVSQLFVEAFLLSAAAAAMGLTVAGVGLATAQDLMRRALGDQFPFWLDFGLSTGLVVYVAGLAILGGVIIGVVPALKATGQRVQPGLQQLSTRGSQAQLGRTWTALIVVQVAIAVAVLPYAIYIAGQSVLRATAEAGYPAEEFLSAWLSIEREEAPPSEEAEAYQRDVERRFRHRAEELVRRLEAEPAVAGVTFARHFPGSGSYGRAEAEGVGTMTARDSVPRSPVHGVRVNRVDVDLFEVLDVPILAGRGFVEADSREGSNAVIIDRVFAERVLGGGNVLGRRIRDPGTSGGSFQPAVEQGPWLEVVGVVPDFTIQDDFEPTDPKLYHPMALDEASASALTLAVRIRGTRASAFAARLREITASVDPALQLHELRSAAEAQRLTQQSLRFIALGVAAVALSILLLSAAGIYAMMSFTVARRRREIGIRSALGADARRVLNGIFARASAQLGAGVLAGLVLAAAVEQAAGFGPLAGRGVFLLPLVAVLMMVIGLIAALGPARRGLSVQPTEALRAE